MFKQFVTGGPHKNGSGLDLAKWPLTVCQLTVVSAHPNKGAWMKIFIKAMKS